MTMEYSSALQSRADDGHFVTRTVPLGGAVPKSAVGGNEAGVAGGHQRQRGGDSSDRRQSMMIMDRGNRSMPQMRVDQHAIPPDGAVSESPGLTKSNINNAGAGAGASQESKVNGANDSLASQMQRVKREDMFNGLMQKTIERIHSSSDAGSHAGDGSLVSSPKINKDDAHRRGSAFRSSFNPAKIKMRPMGARRGVRRASLSKADLINSASHVMRRTSGETQIYPTAPEAPSTAAVDLPPLS